ncbi:MAG TPA: tetratricopeptide repeat protein [Bacteroidia bacterium]|jgi:tetratricopeptide (TPR) repeat protein|nr:tetratricopeptide repeat protein [Bacteroidia bacterium]
MAKKKHIPPTKKVAPKPDLVEANFFTNPYVLLGIVLLITLMCFSSAIRNDFTNWDDVDYVTQNSLVKSLSWDNIKAIFTTKSVMGNYHPLAMLSLAIDYHFNTLMPHGYHVTSIVIHLLTVALVFFFVQLLTKQPMISFMVALLFGIHPMHVESVAWVAERKDVLYVFFYFAALISYLFYLKKGRRRIMFFILTTVFFVFSLLSKAQAVTLPIILFFIDYFNSRKFEIRTIREKIPLIITAVLTSFFTIIFIMIWLVVTHELTTNITIDLASVHATTRNISFISIVIFLFVILYAVWIFAMNMFEKKGASVLILEKIPFIAIALLMGMIAVIAQKETGAIKDVPNNPLFERILFAGYSFLDYGWKLIWPGSLSAYYPYPDKPFPLVFYIAPFVALGLVLLAVKYYKNRMIVFGSGFYIANIFLLLQLLPVGGAMMAERYSYLCSFGLFFMAGKGIFDFIENKKFATYKYPVIVLLLCYGVYLGHGTYERNKVWNNSKLLWLNVIEQYKNVPIAYNNLGSYYQKHEQLDSALMNFNEALRLKAQFPEALTNRSDIWRVRGNYAQAIADCDSAIAADKNCTEAYMNRGIAYCFVNKFDEALHDFTFVVSRKTGEASLYTNRGNLYDMKGKTDSAISDYTMAIKLDPENPDDYLSLAKTQFKIKKYDEAIQNMNKAEELHSTANNLYIFRSQCYREIGNYAAALKDAMTARNLGLQINEDYLSDLKKHLPEGK